MSKSRAPAWPAKTLPQGQIVNALGDLTLPGKVEDFFSALLQPKRNVIRCRREIRAALLPLPTIPVPWYGLGHRPTIESPKPSRFLSYAAGDYYVQDAGSLLALAAVGADTSELDGQLICDLCAAPGGKASALVEAIGAGSTDGGGFVLANEVIRSRIGALQINLARTGSDRFAVSNVDPDVLADRLSGVFDIVLVDAPCSGQAMLGRGKQKVSSLSKKQIQHSASRQRRILDAAIRLLRDGGKLVYSTCTFAQAENEAHAERLIDAGVAQSEPARRLAAYESGAGCYRLWPHIHDCAGSFAASLRVHQGGPTGKRRRRDRDQAKPLVDLTQWYDSFAETTRLRTLDSVIFGWPRDAPDWVDEIAVAGPELAHRAGQTWKPSHAAALRRVPRAESLQVIEIDDETAKVYLRGEPIGCDGHGWHVVRLGGRPLGWVKGDGALGKNHLPTAARMQGELTA
jgi:16S rRNA C967 or C1407 C5-methylase (RsmB/RsmF family)/NOL1/NOP2/fmu family ribosome biogenesis protein